MSAGMAWSCGERARYGVFSTMSVGTNLTISDLAPHTAVGRLDHKSERVETARWIDDLGIVASGPGAAMTTLSGGNQQKVLVARALRLDPAFLVLDDPTAGIDVGAREQVHGIIADHASASMSVLITSTDSDELARLCDRVLVMSRGRVVAELRRGVDLDDPSIDHAQVAAATACRPRSEEHKSAIQQQMRTQSAVFCL